MSSLLSKRGAEGGATLDIPWRYAESTTYDPAKNKSGLIAFASSENRLSTEDAWNFIRDNVKLEEYNVRYDSDRDIPRFSRALAKHLNEYLKPHSPITEDMVKISCSATAMHDLLAWCLAEPGEGILLSRPVYGRFEHDFGNKSQVKAVYADTNVKTCQEPNAVDEFERALTKSEAEGVKIRALLIVNPNNPLGKCYPRETIVRLMQFCQKHRIHVISDEIYACSVFDSGDETATPFSSVLSVDFANIIDSDLVHVTYGMSKDFAVGGLMIGAIISRNKPLLQAVQSALPLHTISGPSLAIGVAMLEDDNWRHSFIESSRAKVAKAYRFVTQGLQDMGVEYVLGGNAGFFVYINLSPYLPSDWEGDSNAEFALARKLVAAGVYLHPREEHPLEPGWFRLVFNWPEAVVAEGLKRIKKVIQQ